MRRAPEVLTCESTHDTLESELQDHFLGLIPREGGDGFAAARPGMTRRNQRTKLVRDFIRENSHRRILLQELWAASGLSRRGGEYLFLDLLGMRASALLMQSRLHGVRRELLAAEPRHGLVKQCALNWGFWHLGRFAAEYQALFGEQPSRTLNRKS